MRAWCADPDLPASMALASANSSIHSLNKQSKPRQLSQRACQMQRTAGTCRLFTLAGWCNRSPRARSVSRKLGANCARLPALWDEHTSRWRPQLSLLLASNAAGRMSYMTIRTMPRGEYVPQCVRLCEAYFDCRNFIGIVLEFYRNQFNFS
jgi:hypothetical protein